MAAFDPEAFAKQQLSLGAPEAPTETPAFDPEAFAKQQLSLGAPEAVFGGGEASGKTGTSATWGLTPVQEQKVAEVKQETEKGLANTLLLPYTAPMRFLTGAKKPAEALAARYERQNVSELKGEKPIQFIAKEVMRTAGETLAGGVRLGLLAESGISMAGVKALPFALRVGKHLTNAARLALVNGAGEGVAKLLETGDIQEASQTAGTVAGIVGGISTAIPGIGGAGKIAGRAIGEKVQPVLERIAKPVLES